MKKTALAAAVASGLSLLLQISNLVEPQRDERIAGAALLLSLCMLSLPAFYFRISRLPDALVVPKKWELRLLAAAVFPMAILAGNILAWAGTFDHKWFPVLSGIPWSSGAEAVQIVMTRGIPQTFAGWLAEFTELAFVLCLAFGAKDASPTDEAPSGLRGLALLVTLGAALSLLFLVISLAVTVSTYPRLVELAQTNPAAPHVFRQAIIARVLQALELPPILIPALAVYRSTPHGRIAA